MKRNYFITCVLLCTLVLLTACKASDAKRGTEPVQSQPQTDSDGSFGWEDRVVPISFEGATGNAVIVEKDDASYVLCTAGHVVSTKSRTAVVDGHEVTVEDCFVSENVDVAFFRVQARQLEIDQESYSRASLDSTGFNALKEKDEISVCGFWGGQQELCTGTVLNCWIYMENFGYHMLWGKVPGVKRGMSGCGVFDGNGNLLGILCGGNDEDEVAILPVGLIEAEWKRYLTQIQK